MALRLVETRRQEEIIETSYGKCFKASFLSSHARSTTIPDIFFGAANPPGASLGT